MPVTRDHQETLRFAGTCADWFARCVQGLQRGGFTQIRADEQSFIIDADYRGFTIDGSIRILLTHAGDEVEMEIHIIAAVDNIWAYLRPPVERIRRAFRSRLN
jgi:hypothetical protein